MLTKWIWTKTKPSENLYAIARTDFEYSGNSIPELRISADTNFAAFLNGKFIGCGQFSDFPDEKTYTAIPFEKNMKYLYDHDYAVISMREV